MASLIVGCFHSGRQLLGLAEGAHRLSVWQREGWCAPFFCGDGPPASASQTWNASQAGQWRGGIPQDILRWTGRQPHGDV